MQLPYTFFFSYGILECCSWNSQMAVLNHSKYIPSTYQVIYTQYTIMYIHNIQQMVSTSVLVSVHDRFFSCLEKHCTFISLKALTISWENQVIGTLCCFLGVKIQYTCIWTGYGSFNTSVYPSKICLKNSSPLSVKIATLPNSQNEPSTHVLKVLKSISDTVLFRKLACVHIERLYWKGLCTLWNTSVGAVLKVAHIQTSTAGSGTLWSSGFPSLQLPRDHRMLGPAPAVHKEGLPTC